MIMGKFYEAEQPELVVIKGNEFRLYRTGQRLAVSKPSWSNSEGEMQLGKTVSIDLAANKGNQELIELFSSAVEMLRGE